MNEYVIEYYKHIDAINTFICKSMLNIPFYKSEYLFSVMNQRFWLEHDSGLYSIRMFVNETPKMNSEEFVNSHLLWCIYLYSKRLNLEENIIEVEDALRRLRALYK